MTINLGQLSAELDARLAEADRLLASQYPGETSTRQPVHTVYVAADRYDADLPDRWGREAGELLASVPDADFAGTFGVPPELAQDVRARVADKLAREPIEDLRIDFEDGFGDRGDEAEDAAVASASKQLLTSLEAGTAPPFFGIRFKSFERSTRHRGIATLAGFVSALAAAGPLPEGLVVTFPKVTSTDQVAAMVYAAQSLERDLGLAPGSLRFEIQIETPQSVLGPDGTALVARMIHLGEGRVSGLHYGTYDYSAFCGIAAAYQSMEHPAADHAKAVMQAAAAGTGVRLSDGSTNVIPVGDADQVRSAWQLHARLTRRSLERGYYQGWDLHPAQLPSRYAATYAFYRKGLPAAAQRLRNYVHQISSNIMDEPATARALAEFVVRALDCGATDDAEVARLSDLDRAQINRLARR